MKKWVTVPQAAEILNVTERTIHSRIKAHKIETRKEDGNRFVYVEVPEPDDQALHEENGSLHETSPRVPQPFLNLLQEKDGRIGDLQDQVEKKDEQINHLQQLLAMKEQNLAAFGERLDHAQLQLQSLQAENGKSWWQRTFRRQ